MEGARMRTHVSDRPDQEKLGTTVSPPVGMVPIPAGCFLMGADDGGEFEGPVHDVDLGDFYLDETPVTNGMFARFVAETDYRTEAERAGQAWGYTGSEFGPIVGLGWYSYAVPGREDHPVVLVTWNDASAYARWAGKRLPTEAEWEKAARGGWPGALYPWGHAAPDGTQCNFAETPCRPPPTTVVKRFPSNDYGLYDMVGNVWQWCADWFATDSYLTSTRRN